MLTRVLITLILFVLSLPIFAKDIYDFKLESAESSNSLDFSSFKKRPLLIVNIATKCGYTGQLDDLEKLYKKYKDKGFQIIGIPSNDF